MASNVLFLDVGDRIIVVVQKQRNFGPEASSGNTAIANRVKQGDVRHAVVVRSSKQIQRLDGSVVKFDDNACVLINKSGDPLGTRLNGKPTLRRERLSDKPLTVMN